MTRHHHGGANGHHHHHTSTAYYVTFQVESGDRMELHVACHEYGLLVEGDNGNLTFQGTRYLGFELMQEKINMKVDTTAIQQEIENYEKQLRDDSAPNAVEELRRPRKHPTAEKAEAIKEALRYLEAS